MSITVIAEVWRALKVEIDGANLSDAADTLISVLIENDYETSDIKEAFRRESEVMQALRDYKSQYEEEEFEEDEFEEDDENEEEEW